MTQFDQAFWDDRYRSAHRLWSGNPNPHLVTYAQQLPPGRALDVGCGEGADAIWLAQRGWQVDAVDVSQVAIDRAAAHALEAGAEVAARISWHRRDLTQDDLPGYRYDLVTAQYLHLPRRGRERLLQAVARATAPGGTLLFVGHHPSDLGVVPRPPEPELFFTGVDLRPALTDGRWEILTDEAAPRTVAHPDTGAEVTIHDTVFRARLAQPHGDTGA